jgi:hypothetical protein
LIVGRPEGGGIEILARSACASVVPGSAWRPFLPVVELSLDADDKLWVVTLLGFSRADDGSASERSIAMVLRILVSVICTSMLVCALC